MKPKLLFGALACAAVLGAMVGCGAGRNQNPIATDDDLATTHPAEALQDKAVIYTTRIGDTLGAVAARPEIYGDPELWPLLVDANADRIKEPSAESILPEDLLLDVPRGQSDALLDVARERARSVQAKAKKALKPKPTRVAAVALAQPTAVPATPVPTLEPTPVDTPVIPAEGPAPAPEPAKPVKAKKGLFPLFLLLLFLLGALGAILAYFLKRDKREGV